MWITQETSLLRFTVQPYKDSLCQGHCMCWWFPWTKILPRQHKVNSLLRGQCSVQVKLFPTKGLVLSPCSATEKLTQPTICSFQSLCPHIGRTQSTSERFSQRLTHLALLPHKELEIMPLYDDSSLSRENLSIFHFKNICEPILVQPRSEE